jgi:hypothetical protein
LTEETRLDLKKINRLQPSLMITQAKLDIPRASKRLSFAQKHLDPADRLGEVLFGVIMMLTFTLTAGFAQTQVRKECANCFGPRLDATSPGA